jgi:alcohol dehydrogenase, propanol-preferring
LHEVIALAERGLITPTVRRYALDDALDAYEDMRNGKLEGRAVITPG